MEHNCVEKAEQTTLRHLQEKNPDRNYDQNLNHFDGLGLSPMGFSMEHGNTPYLNFKARYTFTKTNGETSTVKTHTVSIYPSFCPFCGIKLDEK